MHLYFEKAAAGNTENRLQARQQWEEFLKANVYAGRNKERLTRKRQLQTCL